MPGPPAVTSAGDMDGRLRSLAEMLRQRGLHARLVSYLTDGVRNYHYDAITVTNPAAPERGSMQIEKEGVITWEDFGSPSEPGIAGIVSQAAGALLAAGSSGDCAAT